jgi:tripartite-type tricarboxylate transporter receptor subunit TctC
MIRNLSRRTILTTALAAPAIARASAWGQSVVVDNKSGAGGVRETMPELKPFDVSAWFGAFLPGGAPAPIVEAPNTEMKRWLAMPETLERFRTNSGCADYGTPAEFKKFVDSQIALWKSVIDKEGLKLDAN